MAELPERIQELAGQLVRDGHGGRQVVDVVAGLADAATGRTSAARSLTATWTPGRRSRSAGTG